MEQNDHSEHDEHNRSDSPPARETPTGNGGPASGPLIIGTDNPDIRSGPAARADWQRHPDETMVIETSRIREPNEEFNPGFVMVPVESNSLHDRAHSGNGKEKANSGKQKGGESDKKKRDEKEETGENEDEPGRRCRRVRSSTKRDPHRSADRPEDKTGHSAQSPSLMRILLFAGVVALVCGVAGAWVYSYFFGSGKSGDQKSSSKDSGASNDSGSSNDSDSSKSSGSSGKDSDKADLRQAQAAWMTAVNELHQAQEGEKSARRSDEDSKAVLDFFKKTLLSAGRPGDVSLPDAFWAGGQGKDVMLRKAVDVTETQVADAFVDRPVAEALIREMLGLAYLNLGESTLAVKQYERALALREAMQGISLAETAACRNQLAVAYRVASRPAEAGRLFDHNTNSPAQAAALGVRGSMLLMEKKPAEAELKLRDCLMIRQKIQPDDWTTFDTESTLGEAVLDQNRFADAEPLLLSGYQGLKQREQTIPSQDKLRLTAALERLVKLYERWGKVDTAIKWRRELEGEASRKQAAVPRPS